ncbi:MAG TPA: ABC transporter permease [Chloroflexota bacterium]|nr:ABC transporter permease [Chloroflexota bacterium]
MAIGVAVRGPAGAYDAARGAARRDFGAGAVAAGRAPAADAPEHPRHPRRAARVAALAAWGLIGFWSAAAVFGPALTGDPLAVDTAARLQPPSAVHWLGTDQFGRDVLARVAAGAQYAFAAVGITTIVAGAAGAALGLLAGYAGGKVDALLGRVIDLWLALPGLLFAIAIAGAYGPSFANAMLAIGFMRIPSFARVARASATGVRAAPYVAAARAIGAGRQRVLWRHILPNVLGPLLALAGARASTALLAGSALGFVGLGAPVPEPEWGALVAAGRPYLGEAWWVSALPCAAIVSLALGFQLLGDVLADRFNRAV